jgi:hypothetical protein
MEFPLPIALVDKSWWGTQRLMLLSPSYHPEAGNVSPSDHVHSSFASSQPLQLRRDPPNPSSHLRKYDIVHLDRGGM